MREFSSKSLLVCLLISGSVLTSGCSVLKASPAPDSGFIQHPERMHKMDERAPFDRAWIGDPKAFQQKKETYKKLCIRPVNTDHLFKQSWWDDLNLQDAERLHDDIAKLARYMHDKFSEDIKNDPRHALEVVPSPGPNTFVLELALVELKPTKPVINAVGSALGFLVPGGGVIKVVGTGTIAIEAVLRDGVTNEELVLFDYTWFGHAKETIDDWSAQYVELASTPLSHRVEGSSHFTLKPW